MVHIKKVPIPIRFMEMTGFEAYEQFKAKHSTVIVSKSTFNSLRPRQVYITFFI